MITFLGLIFNLFVSVHNGALSQPQAAEILVGF